MPVLTLELLGMVVFAIVALLALVTALAGGRLLRLWLALVGLLAGVYLGLTYGGWFFPSPRHQLIVAAVAGVLLAGLFSILTRVGALFAGGAVLVLIADLVLRLLPVDTDGIRLYVFGGAFLLGAVLGFFRLRPFLIFVTAASSGWLLSFCAAGLLDQWPLDHVTAKYAALSPSGLILILISTAVWLIGGSVVQFKLTCRRKVVADGAQEKTSVESDLSNRFSPLLLPDEGRPDQASVAANLTNDDSPQNL
ncbi:MAG: TMEM198/TM7SF3 family protein [Clostridiaceae bacterium]|nr:TMEM198/TM7SF3 family protein [Clostridiaceae bacterium]